MVWRMSINSGVIHDVLPVYRCVNVSIVCIKYNKSDRMMKYKDLSATCEVWYTNHTQTDSERVEEVFHIEYEWCIIHYLINLINTSFSLIHLSSSQFSLFSSFNPLYFHYEQWMKWYDMKLSIHDSRMNDKIVSFIINKYNQYLSILHN